MDSTYLSLITFVILTAVYYLIPSVGKLPITLDTLNAGLLTNGTYAKSNLFRTGLFFGSVVLVQFAINAASVVARCGGSAGKNIGVAALMTVIPWGFIFGMMVVSLQMWPSLKTAFSDVIGYFCVSSRANDILSDLLVTPEIGNTSPELAATADTIMKLLGNKAILINQIVPENFLQMWETMRPLIRSNVDELAKKAELLETVVMRDNIGEAMWYFYTAILITSIVSYNIMSRGCVKDPAAMKAEHDDYLTKQAAIKSAQSPETVYTM